MTARAVDSAFAQTLAPLEVIVVDDGSTDDTRRIAERYADRPFLYLRNDTSQGAAAARNRGIEAARGELVAFLDSDDVWLPEKLERQALLLTQQPDVAAVYCRHEVEEEQRGTRAAGGRLFRGDVRAELIGGWCPATTSLFMVRRSALREVGGFDERLRSFHDYDLWLRLSERHRFDYVDEPLVRFFKHSGQRISLDPERRLEALDRFLEKWRPVIEQSLGPNGFRRRRRAKRASNLKRLGVEALRQGELTAGRALLARSLRERPTDPRAWIQLAASFAGRRGYAALRRRLGGSAA